MKAYKLKVDGKIIELDERIMSDIYEHWCLENIVDCICDNYMDQIDENDNVRLIARDVNELMNDYHMSESEAIEQVLFDV